MSLSNLLSIKSFYHLRTLCPKKGGAILTHLHSYNKKIHKKTGFTNPAFFNTNCFTYQDALQHPSLMNLKIKTHSVICDSKAITNILKKNLMHKKCTE